MTEIRTAWQSMSDDGCGIGKVPGNYFWSYLAAKQESDGWAGRGEPKKHTVIVTEEGIFPLESCIRVFSDNDEVVRTRALSKLSAEEMKALGLK